MKMILGAKSSIFVLGRFGSVCLKLLLYTLIEEWNIMLKNWICVESGHESDFIKSIVWWVSDIKKKSFLFRFELLHTIGDESRLENDRTKQKEARKRETRWY